MKNIKLLIEYDGTNYSGWQRQTNALSVQQVLEEALAELTGESITIIGSGRTDSGVHAKGQVANFATTSSIPPDKFSYAINTLIPPDIRILHSQEVSMDFHARYSAVAKRYRYSVLTRPHAPAIGRNYYYHIPDILDVDAMNDATRYIIGTHDFKAFQSGGASSKSTVRTVYEAYWKQEPPCRLYFNVKGNGFLYNMIRILVGTFIEIGRHKISSSDMKNILESGKRNNAGPTAPPHGLCLEQVYYRAY
ncbi:MAG: tRNA pseudouridine(38-40) synthase TruA [Clostridiales bacterium]|jgi:tRNA pseudouridine38-40 synthase|nr:tRNA pseudouridine(38-40) synthase TruA [Clostridiales bacterium]